MFITCITVFIHCSSNVHACHFMTSFKGFIIIPLKLLLHVLGRPLINNYYIPVLLSLNNSNI